MKDIVFALPGIVLAMLCWGAYGPCVHRGQGGMGNERLKPLICVGIAYFVIAIVVPLIVLATSGKLSGNWSFRGVSWSLGAGAAGAVGALGVILALSSGGKPLYVMPLVFGGAPIVNVLVSMSFAGLSWKDVGPKFPFFLAGVIMVGVGAFFVLFFAPKGPSPHSAPAAPAARAAAEPGRSHSVPPSPTQADHPR